VPTFTVAFMMKATTELAEKYINNPSRKCPHVRHVSGDGRWCKNCVSASNVKSRLSQHHRYKRNKIVLPYHATSASDLKLVIPACHIPLR
jgi:hypothetical protein